MQHHDRDRAAADGAARRPGRPRAVLRTAGAVGVLPGLRRRRRLAAARRAVCADHGAAGLRRPGRGDDHRGDLAFARVGAADRLAARQPRRTGCVRARAGHRRRRHRADRPFRRDRLRSPRHRRLRARGALPHRRRGGRRPRVRRRRHESRGHRAHGAAAPRLRRGLRATHRHRPARPRGHPRSGARHGRAPFRPRRRETQLPRLLVRHPDRHALCRNLPRPGADDGARRCARSRAGSPRRGPAAGGRLPDRIRRVRGGLRPLRRLCARHRPGCGGGEVPRSRGSVDRGARGHHGSAGV